MYKCYNCGHISAMKLGKCPGCGEFGSLQENPEQKNKGDKKNQKTGKELQAKQKRKSEFFHIENKELQRVFQKGVKEGGVYLIGGEPGIGKSTIVLQLLQNLLENNPSIRIGYFSGEETPEEIRERLQRIVDKEAEKENIQLFHSTKLEDIITTAETKKHNTLVIDSIQTVYSNNINSPAGSPNQVKYCAEKISETCKNNGITGIIVGHVTKGGEIAGPKYLEHIVDVVMYLEGDRFGQYRFLRSKKNRFGSTDDIGIFEMTLFGLQPVYNIKDKIIANVNTTIPGSAMTIGLDNGRPVLANVEALINKTRYKYPSRTAIGIDSNRLNLIIAIIEKYLKINLGYFDVFVNIPGEFKFNDSGIDVAIAAAIYGQYKNKIIDKNKIFVGEIGLGGQILSTKLHQKRVKEIPDDFENIDFNTIKNIVEIQNVI